MVAISVIVGLLLGSFLSVLLDRWPQWKGAGTGRSKCPHCGHTLAWFDLIPLISWLSVRGHCRYCHSAISALYPVLELTMAAVFGFYAFFSGVSNGWLVMDLAVLFALVALFFFDLRHQMLPDAIVVPLGVLSLARLYMVNPDMLVSSLVTGLCLAGVFGALYAVSRGRWLGFGDVKLAGIMGILFGYPAAIGVTLIAVWAGALLGLGLMALRRASMQTALPFGSFWTAVAVITMMWHVPARFLSALFIPSFR